MNIYSSTVDRNKLFGRRKLIAPPLTPLTSTNVGLILNEVLPLHFKNAAEIDYLYNFFKGNQPILERKKEVRPEITNIVIENRALEIVEFKKGYEFSHPVQYINAGKDDTAPIEKLNSYARVDGKEAKDLELAEWFYISGNAYRFCFHRDMFTEDEPPYYSAVLDPRNTFVVYSNEAGNPPLFAGVLVEQKDLTTNATTYKCAVYTKTKRFEWTVKSEQNNDYSKEPATEAPNGLGLIPIVEYVLNENRLGYVELCYWLFNAINTVGSNRIDSIEQFVQAYLVFLNVDLPDQLDSSGKPIIVDGQHVKVVPKSGDAILVGNQQGNADVKFIYAVLDQEQTQVTKDDLLRSVYEICGVPDRQNRNQGGGDTGQAVVLRNGWGAAEARAMSTEKLFKKAEYEYLKIVLKICRDTQGVDIEGLALPDIDVKFTRNRSDGLQTKSQSLKMLLEAGVNPEDSYITSELFSDPSAVWARSEEYQKGVLPATSE